MEYRLEVNPNYKIGTTKVIKDFFPEMDLAESKRIVEVEGRFDAKLTKEQEIQLDEKLKEVKAKLYAIKNGDACAISRADCKMIKNNEAYVTASMKELIISNYREIEIPKEIPWDISTRLTPYLKATVPAFESWTTRESRGTKYSVLTMKIENDINEYTQISSFVMHVRDIHQKLINIACNVNYINNINKDMKPLYAD